MKTALMSILTLKEFKGTPEWNEVETLDADGLILQPGDTNNQMLVNWLTPQKEVIMYNTVEEVN